MRHHSCMLKPQALTSGLQMLHAVWAILWCKNDHQSCFRSEDTTVQKLMHPIINVLLHSQTLRHFCRSSTIPLLALSVVWEGQIFISSPQRTYDRQEHIRWAQNTSFLWSKPAFSALHNIIFVCMSVALGSVMLQRTYTWPKSGLYNVFKRDTHVTSMTATIATPIGVA